MKLTVKDINGNDTGEVDIAFTTIDDGRGTQAVHDAVVAHLANRRMGTASTKTMGEVAGTGKKPWRQKGTGRARAGSFQSPLWVGGGVTFGPKPRDFGKRINHKTKLLALRKALSERVKAGDVLVVDELKLESAKTKLFTKVLAALKLSGSTLIVHESKEPNLCLAARNVARVELTTGTVLNVYQVLKYDKVLFTRPALDRIQERLI